MAGYVSCGCTKIPPQLVAVAPEETGGHLAIWPRVKRNLEVEVFVVESRKVDVLLVRRCDDGLLMNRTVGSVSI